MNFSFASNKEPFQRSIGDLNLLSAPDNVPIPKLLGHRFYLSTPAICAIFFLSIYLRWLSLSSGPVVKGPVAGYRSSFEPTFLLRFRFILNAVKIMNDGYYKFKDRCYIVRRMDTDVTVIPLKYLDELRKSGRDELNGTNANIDNVLGQYTNLDEMRHNDQFLRTITHCLNPNINEFMREAQDEMNHSFKVDIPDFEGQEWKSVDIHIFLRRIIGRIASRMMLGLPYCRDETMLSITESHTICVFAVALILRRFPPILHPFISWLIPYRWAILRNVRATKNITQRILENHLATEEHVDTDGQSTEPITLFKWMLAVTVAAVYTSSQVCSHMLVFLAANPQIAEELRNEVNEHAASPESIDYGKLHKMEACLAETLRLNPPLTNAPQRRAMQDVILKDGVIIPKGALVAFPSSLVGLDPSIYPEPQQFKLRPEGFASPVTTPTKKHLAFGWGTQACPGRFLAAKEIKMITARVLMDYDLELAPRPAKMRRAYDIEDFRVLNPNMRVLMRRRTQSPFSTTLG